MDWWENGDNALMCLEGNAGTGKTYLSNMIVEGLLMEGQNILYTAPTNKAVKVARAMAEYDSPNSLSYSTVHSALGMVERRMGGKVKYVQAPYLEDKTKDADIVFVDEASMLSDDIFALLETSAQTNGTLFLFIGDNAQIPPVNHAIAIPFSPKKRKAYDMGVASLTEVVRQKGESPILDVATFVRQNLRNEEGALSKYFQNKVNDNGCVIFQKQTPDFVNEVVPSFFTSEQFEADSNFAKVLAWRNKTVDSWNRQIRGKLYNTCRLSKIMPNERLIANKPIVLVGEKIVTIDGLEQNMGEDVLSVIYQTNDEFTVTEIEEGTKLLLGHEVNVYNLVTQYVSPTGQEVNKQITVLHESSEDDWEKVKKAEANRIIDLKKAGYKVRSEWKKYYLELDKLADVKYNYAITCHKSQGSTYQNVFIIENDIDYSRNVTERNRIKYTALTRATERVFLVGK